MFFVFVFCFVFFRFFCFVAGELQHSNRKVTVTVKQDGTSLTVSHDRLCGRNFEWRAVPAAAKEAPESADADQKATDHNGTAAPLTWDAAAKHYVAANARYDIQQKLGARFARTGERLYLQCEVVGPGINGNRLGLKTLDVQVTLARFWRRCARADQHESLALIC